jgi:DNA gyrase/topoisomerase IV subunit A
MIITDDGTIIRTPVSGIPVYEGNNTSGVIVMRLSDNNRIISFAATKSDEEEAAEIEASIEKSEATAAQDIAFPIADEDEI